MDPCPGSTDGPIGALMSIDRISLSNGAIDRALQSTATEELRVSSLSNHSRSLAADDAISLSESARNADRLANIMNSSRTSRLDAVREAITNGTYKISGMDIASKMIALNTH
jgi:anti-sigma28 factor (negative regulator of flagellin synthesis)